MGIRGVESHYILSGHAKRLKAWPLFMVPPAPELLLPAER